MLQFFVYSKCIYLCFVINEYGGMRPRRLIISYNKMIETFKKEQFYNECYISTPQTFKIFC